MSLESKLLSYSREDHVRFHMPGHKGRVGMYEDFSKIDITEIPGFDDLHNPTDDIKKLEDDIKILYHAKDAFFSVNGSTAAIMAGIFSMVRPGDLVLVNRNAHKSVYNALMLSGATPVFVNEKTDRYGIIMPIRKEEVVEIIEEVSNIKLAIFTYPTYEGVLINIKDIYSCCKERGIPVFLDCAHGAHLELFDPVKYLKIMDCCEMASVGLHKSLPFLTQTAALLVSKNCSLERDFLARYVACFESSSPSYILMYGAEKAMDLLGESGNQRFKELKMNLLWFRKNAKKLKNIKVRDEEGFDETKIVLTTEKGKESIDLFNLLRSRNIEPEMVTQGYCLLMTSLMNTRKDFELLLYVLEKIDEKFNESKEDNQLSINEYPKSEIVIPMRQATNSKPEHIELKRAEGKISAGFVELFPPGIPLLIPGERIKKEHISLVKKSKALNINVRGIFEEKIPVIYG